MLYIFRLWLEHNFITAWQTRPYPHHCAWCGRRWWMMGRNVGRVLCDECERARCHSDMRFRPV